MPRPAQITTPFPSVRETARRLGVSEHDARVLSDMAERSERTGNFMIPGIGRVVRVERKARLGRGPVFRVAKTARDATNPSAAK